jgi:hypothetical protein
VNVVAHVFAGAVPRGFVSRKLFANIDLVAAFVRVQARLARNVRLDDGVDCAAVSDGRMKRAHATAALHKGDHSTFASGTATPTALLRCAFAIGGEFGIFLLAEIRFVGFDNLALAAKRRQIKTTAPHGFANAMKHEPGGVVLAAKFAMELVSGEALFARRRQMESDGPIRQFGVAALHHRAGQDGEVLAARGRAAAVHANLLRGVVLGRSALRANRAVRPACGLEPSPRGGLVVKERSGETFACHRKTSSNG